MRQLNWTNTLFIGAVHALAVVAVIYRVTVNFSWWTIGLASVWWFLCGLAVTGGYHRLFSHKAYESSAVLKLVYLCFGAAAVQNSALKWSADHRRHHANTDQEADPYNIRRGFWWAHIGWVLSKEPSDEFDAESVKDLQADPLVRFQHRYYVPLAFLFALVLPAVIGLAWGDALGCVLVVCFLRLAFQWHSTFAINSFAHLIGNQPYCRGTSARDSLWTALISFGEGYHNFHHRFQSDFRNGFRSRALSLASFPIW